MEEKWVKIKDIVLQGLAVAFVALVVFYPPLVNPSASVLQAVGEVSFADNPGAGDIGREVVYYGQLRRFSTSGDLAFYFYDIDNNRRQYDDPRVWFWASLPDYQDYEKIKPTLEFIAKQSPSAVYRLVGTREADDTGYYDPSISQTPLPSLLIKTIELYNAK